MLDIKLTVGQIKAATSDPVIRSSRKVGDKYTFGVLGINRSSTCTFTFRGQAAKAVELRVFLCHEDVIEDMEESDFELWTKEGFKAKSDIQYTYTYDADEEDRVTCFRFDWFHRPAGAKSDDDLVLQCSQFYKAFYHAPDCTPGDEEYEGLEQVTKAELGTVMSYAWLFPALYAEKAAAKQLKDAIASTFSATSPEVNDSGFIDSLSSPASKDPDLFPSITSAPLSPPAPETTKLPQPTGLDGKVFLNSQNKNRAKTAFVLSLEENKKKQVEECSSSPAPALADGQKYCDCGCGVIMDVSPAATSSSKSKSSEEEESEHSSESEEEKEDEKPSPKLCPCGCGEMLDPQSTHSSRAEDKADVKMEEAKPQPQATLTTRVQQDADTRAPVPTNHTVLGVTLRLDEDEADQQAYTIEHAYLTEKASTLRKHQEEYAKAFKYDVVKQQEFMQATHKAELELLEFEKAHSLGLIRKRKADGSAPSPKRVKVALRDMALTPFMSRMIARHPENGRQFFAIKDHLDDREYGMADLMNVDEPTCIALQVKCKTNMTVAQLIHKALNEGI